MVKHYFLLLLLFPLSMMASNKHRLNLADCLEVDPMLFQADSLWQHFQVDESLEVYQTLAHRAHQEKHYKDELECYLRMSDILYETDRLNEAKIVLFKARELDAHFLDGAHHAYITHYKGKVFFKNDELEQAIRYWQASISTQGLQMQDSLLLSASYAEMSFAHNLLGDQELASIFNRLSKEIHLDAINFRNEAQLQMKKRNYKRALYYLEAGLLYADEFSEVARLKSDMAWAHYKNKHYTTALEEFEKALGLYERYSQLNTAAIYNNIGIIRLNQGEDLLARDYFQKAKKIHSDHFGDDHISIAKDYTAIGKSYQKSGMLDSARFYFEEAGDRYNVHLGTQSRYVCRNNIYLAQILALSKEYPEAIFRADQAGFSLTEHPDPYLQLRVKELKSWIYLQQYLAEDKTAALVSAAEFSKQSLGLIDEVLYRTSDVAERLALLEEFESVYTNGITIQGFLQTETINKETTAEVAFEYTEKNKANVLKAMLWEAETKRFAGIPAEVLEQETQLRKDKARFEILHEKASQRKNFNYRDSLLQNAEAFNALVADMEANFPRYYELKYAAPSLSFSQLQQNLDKETAIISYYMQDSLYHIFTITNDEVDWQTHHKLIQEEDDYEVERRPLLRNIYGKIRDAFDNDEGEMPDEELPPNPTKVKNANKKKQKEIPDEELPVSPPKKEDVKKKKNETSKPDFQYFSNMVTTEELDLSIHYFLRAIRKFDKETLASSGYTLYKKLILPVKENIKGKSQLIIIPHNELYYLPFEALMTKKQTRRKLDSYNKLPYLIHDYTISYQHSASLFYELKTRIQPTYTQEFTGFAPVFSDSINAGYVWESNQLDSSYHADASNFRDITTKGKWFKELKYSENEVMNIAKLFDNRAKVYLHQKASEANFKQAKLCSRMVHIASHSFVDESDLANNGLVFANTKHPKEDNILYTSETFNLDIKADLLVLSSCESGLGNLAKGEGVMALYRGFLYAGCQNVMVSLWKVYDEDTSLLMQDFYKESLNGKSYAEALRDAKLKLLENESTAAPRKWSGFILIGQ